MPQLRQSPTTKEWVIIATERAKRPEDFQLEIEHESHATPGNCPFCSGNESLTPGELFAFRTYGTKPDTPGWWIRVVPNKFPALIPTGDPKRVKTDDFFISMDGIGQHEVLIESPDHNQTMATMEQKQVEEIFLAYKERFAALKKYELFEMILIFKNHGRYAGTSLSHPHSQIIATPVTPMHIRHRLEEAMRFFDDNGECAYCKMIEKELELKERIVLETDNFVAFIPFAARAPFDIHIFPKNHDSSFDKIKEIRSKELGFVMRQVLYKIYKGLKDPAYNYMVLSSPCHEDEIEYFHWHIELSPRVSTTAGFELGSGIFINTVIPEEAAKFLREIKTLP
jgi:UDPglucose--hexose-1-phosphate uridylyltransferase